ncbi:MAG: 2-oxoglutarate dehydrogenase complex dihydrolipoyllysine-residue succinyltransferase [Bdellovibrionaceae bacterium]|nr:2-oxoglutarate dehydrogenase complex dihydrolipoyllysine-residue succinyltransferase [Pseudobdellovibrionaceae bacterium]
MKAEIKVPAVGESITEATIGEWAKKNGEFVKRDEVILMLETDKASVEVVAPNDGVLTTLAKAGDVVKIGATVAHIDTEGVASAGMSQPDKNKDAAPASVPTRAQTTGGGIHPELQAHMSPAVRRVVDETGVNPAAVKGTGKDGRLTKADVEQAARATAPAGASAAGAPSVGGVPAPAKAKSEIPPLPMKAPRLGAGEVVRKPMTTIRKRIAERLVQAQHTAAILTTFNEVDMSAVLDLRERYKDQFKKRYDVSLGFMGFFVKAVIEGLRTVPQVNNSIEGTDILEKNFYNIGVAVGTEKGLVVPVIRDADQLSISEIELSIKHYALKARDGKLTVDDLSGGTFTISNGGVYGSLMSTPILNPPQSGILGMHKIEDRPVVVNKQVVVRPMMYLALSYDHRIIDGKEAVTFLVKVKECIEDPSRILLEI